MKAASSWDIEAGIAAEIPEVVLTNSVGYRRFTGFNY
jgi:hypothetical protein